MGPSQRHRRGPATGGAGGLFQVHTGIGRRPADRGLLDEDPGLEASDATLQIGPAKFC